MSPKKNPLFVIIIISLTLLSACASDKDTIRDDSQVICGDGLCAGNEERDGMCPQDCGGETDANDTYLQTLDFYNRATGDGHGAILKLFNPVIDEKNRRLYIVGSKTTSVGVIDIDTDKLIETFDIGVLGGFLIFSEQKLYLFDFIGSQCYEIDTVNKKAREIPHGTCEALVPKKAPVSWKSLSFKETGYRSFPDGTTGFPADWTQDLNGAYGVIEISDPSGMKLGEIVHGPDALYFAIDSHTGKLYTSNTGDGSLSVFDLNRMESTRYCEKNSCLIKNIDVGDSADQVIADSLGTLYVRNRLGGSTIIKYSPSTGSFFVIDNENSASDGSAIWNSNWQGMALGMWPTDMALSKDEQRLYVLSHYGALIDVIDTSSSTVVNKIRFSTALKPRTDSISALALDRSRDRLFAVFPELGLIGVADGKEGIQIGMIDLTKNGFDISSAVNAGPGLVNLAVDETRGTLYVFFDGRLISFDGDTLKKEKEVSVTKRIKGERQLAVNPGRDELYLGASIFSLDTLEEIGSFPKGERVEGIDPSTHAVSLKETVRSNDNHAKQSLMIYESIDRIQTREWAVDNIGEIVNLFFDYENEAFYVADFLAGSVLVYDMDDGSSPGSITVVQSAQEETRIHPAEKPDRRCGDGVCTGPETSMNCPSDCGSQSPEIDGNASVQGRCGDGVCSGPETSEICPADCKSVAPASQGRCGDGVCDTIEKTMGKCLPDCG